MDDDDDDDDIWEQDGGETRHRKVSGMPDMPGVCWRGVIQPPTHQGSELGEG